MAKQLDLENRARERIRELETIVNEAKEAEIELRALRVLLNGSSKPMKNKENKAKPVSVKPGPTAAVLSLVGARPGISRTDAIEELMDKIESSSPNKRRLLYMTISNLEGLQRSIFVFLVLLPRQALIIRNLYSRTPHCNIR
jgi:hypothetical protein